MDRDSEMDHPGHTPDNKKDGHNSQNLVNALYLGNWLSVIVILCWLLFTHDVSATEYGQPAQTQHLKIPGAVHDILPLRANRSLIAAYGEGVILADLPPSGRTPGQATIIHSARYSRQAEAIALSADQRQVFVANGSAGLDILTLSNNSLQLAGRFNTPSYAFDVALAPNNRVVYVADNTHGVIVLDVTQAQKPRQIAHIPTRASSAGVTLARNGQTLYIADQAHGIHIVDVRHPQQPKTLARINTAGQAQSIALSANGKYLFSANNNGGLQIFSLQQPTRPQLLGRTPGQNAFAVTLSTSGRTAFVADLYQGVQLIDVSQPAQPRLLRTLKTNGQPEKVSLSPGQKAIWVANGQAGITIFRFP